MVYKTKGVCAQELSSRSTIIKSSQYQVYRRMFRKHTGCCTACRGMDANEVISRLEGIRCGFKPTSCPDQLAKAIRQALNEG